ncbi:hypothetical protein BANRA_05287 [Klebsiella pneumoniae]|nr:hypothetical protein BANRA_05287 [Klebsiella pneumoniae]
MNYIVAQLLGAGAAALCLTAVFGHSLLAGVTRVHMGVITVQCLFHRRCHDFYSDYEHPNDQKPRDYQHCCFFLMLLLAGR